MAAPATANLKNLDGKWVMNPALSGSFDDTLKLQGIGWVSRKAIGMATITFTITETTTDSGATKISTLQTATGGLKGGVEDRVLDGSVKEHKDMMFGQVKESNKWLKISDLSDSDPDDKFLKEGWEKDVLDAGELVCGSQDNDKDGWKQRQVWGFAEVDGKRYHVRKVATRKGKEFQHLKTVYDYTGPA
ncbi:hypothetical protein K402DRAFT_394648 [Aulographum hederae CBS 113979]|uniref:LCCL domain-containing protein n=1 Tax=Aulographum hederae CBS 113979 TaxID=1176131 RepID=A0A6G1GY23_9PEZI|nr:hypothetical protein K402DRAFT_394648 [Aulographum hederae CBS 113979]